MGKMKIAGCHQEVFSKNALEAIVSASSGIPRMLDKTTNSTLLIGSKKNENIITEETVMIAVNDIQI